MARKGRRVRRRAVRRDRQENGDSTAKEATSTKRGGGSNEEALREQYAYVLKDLRRVFILAAIMFALLITLNIVLQ